MAIELFPNNSWICSPPAAAAAAFAAGGDIATNVAAVGSPRISFSRDLSQSEADDGDHERLDGSLLLDSPAASDFDFCVAGESCDHESSTADELFSDGKLLPLPIQPKCAANPIASNPSWVPSHVNHITVPSPPPLPHAISPPPPPVAGEEAKESLKEMIATAEDDGENEEKVSASPAKSSSSFWRFGRSTSLNVSGSGGGGSHRTGLICYLTLLPRSKSAGSNPNSTPKQQRQSSLRKSTSSNGKRRKPSKNGSSASCCSSSSSSSSSYYYGSSSSHYGNSGVRISPVLNVPPPYIPKGSGGNGLFGFGHLLCNGKEKNKSNNSSRKKSLFSAQSQ